MSAKVKLIHLTFCGPSDVEKEIQMAQDVVTEWNTQHGDSLGLFVKHQYWKADAYPDASSGGQTVINRQLIDDSDILVCLFWSRFGSPTGVADSGTEEEIRRGISRGKHVAVYFSDRDPLPSGSESSQLQRLNAFRQELQAKSLSWSFQTRSQFREIFTIHLAKIIHEIREKTEAKPKPKGLRKSVSQKMVGGHGNVQVGGDIQTFNHYSSPPKQKVVLERREGSISPAQGKQIRDWIEALVEATTSKSRSDAFEEWWSRFRNKFHVAKYESLPAEEFENVRKWHQMQQVILTRGIKNKAPAQWRNKRVGAIKAAMGKMGRTKEDYYPELAKRLKIKPFQSLKDLTKMNLDRVYSRVMDDGRHLH